MSRFWAPKVTLSVVLAVTGLIAGCATPHPPPRTSAMQRLRPDGPSPWRETFADPVLADLLARADRQAIDVKTAVARLEQADAQVALAGGARDLTATIGADAATGYAKPASGRSGLRSKASPSLLLAYEVDLFGRLRHAADAAVAERRASQADVAAARLLVGAETARAFVALRLAQAQERTATDAVALASRALALTADREAEKLSDGDDMAQRRRALDQAESDLDAARLEIRLQTLRLTTLTGLSAPAARSADLPSPSSPPTSALDFDVVDHRPDVAAAYARFEAADARRAAAIAAGRPHFEIGLSLGAVDPAVLNLLDARSLAWAAAAGLTHDILDGGRAKARVGIAASEADIAELDYRKTVLQGWRELRSAAAETNSADAALARARQAEADARQALARARLRHTEGLTDGIGLSDVQGRTLDAGRAVSQAQSQALDARIALRLAAGG